MNDAHTEALLIGATNKNNQTTAFVSSVMTRIERMSPRVTRRRRFGMVQFTRPRFAFGLAALALATSIAGFSGYAYAIGTNPVSLITRIISGDTVKVEYKGRHFEYGKRQSYNDVAVTAFAELNTVNGLAFAASNAGAIPKDNTEYLSTPYGYQTPYTYPTLGEIADVTGTSVTIVQRYMLGDKTNASHDMMQTIILPRTSDMQFFKEAKASPVTLKDVGRIVELRQEKATKHILHSQTKASITTRHFIFALNHTLDDFKAADKATTGSNSAMEPALSGIIEKNFGQLDNRCLNNGADLCSPALLSNSSKSLYGKGRGNSNPNVIQFGEGVGLSDGQPEVILRNIYGKLIKIQQDTIAIRSSSGATWTLHFTAVQRQNYSATWKSDLKIGDMVGGSILQDLSSLDVRTVASDHIYNLMRVQ